MSDKTITATIDLDDKAAMARLKELEKEIARLQKNISKNEEARTPFVNQAEKIRDELGKARADVEKYRDAWLAGDTSADHYHAQAISKTVELEKQYGEITDKVGKYDDAIAKSNVDLNKAMDEAGELSVQLVKVKDTGASAGESISRAMAQAEIRMQKFERRIIGLARRVFVFTLITKALRGVRDYLGNAVKVNNEAAAAIGRLKGALMTLAQPILNVIIPAFTALVDMLTKIISAISAIVADVFGTTVEESAKSAENLYNEEKALKKVGGAASKAGKNLAKFDEINKIGEKGGGGGAINPTFDFKNMLEEELAAIELMVSSALLALGAVIAFSGANVPLGIALMALGAVGLVASIANHWTALEEALQGPIGRVYALISGALLVLGAILAFSGANVPLGIALMAIGAVGLATTVIANWDGIKKALEGALGALVFLLSTALLAIGAILAFSGANIPLGIGLMAVGAVGLAASIAANWDSVKELMQSEIGALTAIVSGALLAIGAILAFSGANIPLGIGMMAVGAVGLATAFAGNWDSIKELLQGSIGKVTEYVSLALLAVGAVLAFSGVNIPLGIALLAAGAVGLTTVIAANWDTIKTQLQGTLGQTTAAVSSFMLVLGLILACSGAALPLGIALIAAGAAGLVTASALNWGALQAKMAETWDGIKQWWSSNVAKYFTVEYWNGMGQNIVDGLKNGIAGVSKVFSDWANRDIVGKSEDELGVHSPSTEFKRIGEYCLLGFMEGFKNLPSVTTMFNTEIQNMAAIATNFAETTRKLIEEVYNLFIELLKKAEDATRTTTNNMAAMFRNMSAISVAAIDRITTALNNIPREVTTVHTIIERTVSGGSNLASGNIPQLARGAVIPPNREFLAVLGDQKSGTNIEAPLDTIVQAMQMALGNTGGGRNQTVILEIDGREFARTTYKAYNNEQQRLGVQLGGV